MPTTRDVVPIGPESPGYNPERRALRATCARCEGPLAQLALPDGTCAGQDPEHHAAYPRPNCLVCQVNTCTYCCGHYHCSACNAVHNHHEQGRGVTGRTLPLPNGRRAFSHTLCVGCGSCRERCSCPRCPTCNNVASEDQRCSDCGRCNNFCGCNCPAGYEFWRPEAIPFHFARRRGTAPGRLVSLEVEVNELARGPGFMRAVKKWGASVVSDGSVDAFELNTAPASGDKFFQQVQELGEALVAQKAQVGFNCGVHVHVDTRDYTFPDMRRLILLWNLVEPAMYRLVHPSRQNNRYCQPCGNRYAKAVLSGATPKELKEKFYQAVYQRTPGERFNAGTIRDGSKYSGDRYAALNVHSWMYRGTVENRMHHATVDWQKLANWACLNAYLVDFALTHTEQQIQDMFQVPGRFSPTPAQSLRILTGILQNDWLRAWVELRATQQATQGGLTHEDGYSAADLRRGHRDDEDEDSDDSDEDSDDSDDSDE